MRLALEFLLGLFASWVLSFFLPQLLHKLLPPRRRFSESRDSSRLSGALSLCRPGAIAAPKTQYERTYR